MIRRQSIFPAPWLAPFVDRFWSASGSGPLPFLLPGTGIDIFFHRAAPFSLAAPAGDAPSQSCPRAHLLCLRTRPARLFSAGPVDFFAVRFRAGTARHFLPVPEPELFDCTVDLADLWPFAAPAIESIRSAPSLDAAAIFISRLLAACLELHRKPDPWLDAAAARLYYARHPESIDSVARRAGASRRHLERRFAAVFGVSPKRFQSVARLQRVVRSCALQGSSPLDAALEAGFYDQSHLSKSCREIAGISPARLASLAETSHFYNPPRPR